MRKIKPLIPYNMNYLDAVFRPMFENKLKLSKVERVKFTANIHKDTLDMEGSGMDGIKFTPDRKCETMKVSENLNYKVILDRNVQKNISDCKEWILAYVVIDYSQRVIISEVYYISKEGQKNKQIFKNPF